MGTNSPTLVMASWLVGRKSRTVGLNWAAGWGFGVLGDGIWMKMKGLSSSRPFAGRTHVQALGFS